MTDSRLPGKPLIGALNGVCFGGGLELAVNCDLLIAAESVKLGFPEVKRGMLLASGDAEML